MSGIFFTCKHEDRIAGKGFTSTIHYNSVHKFIPMPQAMKIPDAKSCSMATRKSQELEGGYSRSTNRDKTKVHFATLMDICHLMNVELEPKLKKYKGRVVLRGDTVEDDSGAYAVFTEQGSSASQMTAFKAMDVIARLPDCDRQPADAVSALSQVKLEDAPRLLKIPKSEWSRRMDMSTTTQMAQILVKH